PNVGTKPAPLMVTAVPTGALSGLKSVIVGTGFMIGKLMALEAELLPSGCGLVTTTGTVPGLAMSEAATCALNWPEFTKVVGLGGLLKRTTELPPDPLTKLFPLTVNVKPTLPVSTDTGEIEVITGTGLLMVKLTALDVPPPGAGLKTVTAIA